MAKNYVIMLLRQISSSLPGDAKKIPEEISELSFAQIYLLGELFERKKTGYESLSLSALARESGFSKATICTTLKKLRRSGYVQTQLDDTDNRRKEITLTPQAWKVESSVTQYISTVNKALCAGIPPEDLQATEKSLLAILENSKKSTQEKIE